MEEVNNNIPVADTTADRRDNVTRASYPIPQPLKERLRRAAAALTNGGDAATVETESIQTALAKMVSNSLEAIDAMYFASPPSLRQHECFQHRLCLRVCASVEEQSLTLTDLGAGMTRADLINTLGIGKQQLSGGGTKNSSSKNGGSKPQAYDSTDDEEDDDSSDEEDEEDDEDDASDDIFDNPQEDAKSGQDAANTNSNTDSSAPDVMKCKREDIGGFYAAVCALGLGVRVGTKVC